MAFLSRVISHRMNMPGPFGRYIITNSPKILREFNAQATGLGRPLAWELRMKARPQVVPIETGNGDIAPFRYWAAALLLAASAAWTLTIGTAWLVRTLI